jgi:hypothetical protein
MGVCIGWGTKFKKFRIFFRIFGALTIKNGQFFNSNDRIRIQMAKFQFKRTNHEPPYHNRPLAPTAGGSAGGSTGCYRPARVQRRWYRRPERAPAPPPGPVATSSREGGRYRLPLEPALAKVHIDRSKK